MYEKAKILSDIISNPVEFKPFVIKGISSKYDEYLAIISLIKNLHFIQEDLLKKPNRTLLRLALKNLH